MGFGTLTIADLQATANNTTVVSYGLDRTFEAITNSVEAHNEIVASLTEDLMVPTTDRLRRYGGLDQMTMQDLDEFGTPQAQKITGGSNVGFPLRLQGIGYQWTQKWFQNHSPAEMGAQVAGAMEADIRRIERDIKRAIFTATNTTFVDYLMDNVSLGVKAFVNADSAPIPVGPNGETFTAASHTHYTGTASFINTDLDALILNVAEHYASGELRVYINKAQEATIRAFTAAQGWTPYLDARIVGANNVNQAPGRSLDPIQYYNRPIGIYNGAEVYVKPWVPASYLFCFNASQPRPLAWRTRPGAGQFVMSFQGFAHPLTAKGFEREYGIGVWERVNGAVLYTASGTYASPTIT